MPSLGVACIKLLEQSDELDAAVAVLNVGNNVPRMQVDVSQDGNCAVTNVLVVTPSTGCLARLGRARKADRQRVLTNKACQRRDRPQLGCQPMIHGLGARDADHPRLGLVANLGFVRSVVLVLESHLCACCQCVARATHTSWVGQIQFVRSGGSCESLGNTKWPNFLSNQDPIYDRARPAIFLHARFPSRVVSRCSRQRPAAVRFSRFQGWSRNS